MIYSFDGVIANDVGVSAAVVFHHIAHWIKFNDVHGQNFVNGRYWMYDTVASMQKFLNFYTDRTIKNSIGKLVEAGYLLRDELGQDKYNHTKWYALTDKGMAYADLNNKQKSKFDWEKISQSRKGKNFPIEGDKISQSTIKQNNTQNNTNKSNTIDDPFFTESLALSDALRGFAEMRKKMHKPLTNRAKELIVKKLEKLAPGDEESQIAILDQSVERGWQGVFPLHADANWQGRDGVGKSRLSGGAGKDKSPYAAYFDGDEGEA